MKSRQGPLLEPMCCSAHKLPIDGTLDLHTFQPGETGAALEAYIEACLEEGVHLLRVIHGKGRGTQREIVRKVLERSPHVESFRTDSGTGGWGATLVNLKRPEKDLPRT